MKTRPILTKIVLIVFFTVFASSMAVAQTLYALKIDRKIRSEAIDITAAYQPRLVMGSEQALQFQQVVAKFLVKKRAVKQDTSLSVGAKFKLLKRLSTRENAEMAQVLEPYRRQEYVRIKNEIQPISKPPSEIQPNLLADQEPTIE